MDDAFSFWKAVKKWADRHEFVGHLESVYTLCEI